MSGNLHLRATQAGSEMTIESSRWKMLMGAVGLNQSAQYNF